MLQRLQNAERIDVHSRVSVVDPDDGERSGAAIAQAGYACYTQTGIIIYKIRHTRRSKVDYFYAWNGCAAKQ
jgi:hypothetical protein